LELTDDEIHLIDNFLENMENWNDWFNYYCNTDI
jgi:hypothetical protein